MTEILCESCLDCLLNLSNCLSEVNEQLVTKCNTLKKENGQLKKRCMKLEAMLSIKSELCEVVE